MFNKQPVFNFNNNNGQKTLTVRSNLVIKIHANAIQSKKNQCVDLEITEINPYTEKINF